IFRIEPGALHTKWEAYIMNQTNVSGDDDDSSMTSARLEGFKASLRHNLEQQSQQQSYHPQGNSAASSSFATPKRAVIKSRYGSASTFTNTINVDHLDESRLRSNGNIGISAIMPPSKPSSSSIQFAQRKNISENEETLNGHLELRTAPPNSSKGYRNTIGLLAGVKPYRYMFEKITEKSEALDDRIEAFADIYRKSHPDIDLYNPAYPTQAIVTVVGRICSDANEGKSNERSLVLETSRSLGGGSRVRLDVSELTGFSFFPGQIVVLSGINVNGSTFAVTQVHELPTLEMARVNPDKLVDYHYKKMGGQPLKMIVAAGPYTLSDNLLFEPFAALMNHVSVERPDILLLDRYPKEMQILLVPSLQDIIHETIVLPQPELDARSLGLRTLAHGIYCLPNPAQFTINEMVFAINTTDILMNLCGDEIARNPARTDRMGHVSKYLVEQRNMHPVYPGLTSNIESGVDFNQYDLMDLQKCPDVIILPSKLKNFAKIYDNVVIVNPSQLTKGHAGGTFARMTIHPITQNALDEAVMTMDEDEQSIYHQVYNRCRVDIVRL
ncbi:DNA-directed DNA polymerase alpha subunit pol12, partial [Mortierella sp. AM989]